MQAKNVLYAAVGAPVVAAKKVNERVSSLKGRVSYSKVANKAIDEWAEEGEKVVSGIREGKVVEEISQKVDLDQAKDQVSKLRDQLEDMLATWRHSFRPESAETAPTGPAPKTSAAKQPATKSSTAKKPAAKSSTSKKPAAKKQAAKKPAAKTSAAKTTKSSTATKKSPAKSTASKAQSSS
ncbi:MAG TPA: hypothetical protein VMM14_09020 [Acidimicrobiia bacterium]|nr:hypothetical protein [Acidimicrobiia bacterium]